MPFAPDDDSAHAHPAHALPIGAHRDDAHGLRLPRAPEVLVPERLHAHVEGRRMDDRRGARAHYLPVHVGHGGRDGHAGRTPLGRLSHHHREVALPRRIERVRAAGKHLDLGRTPAVILPPPARLAHDEAVRVRDAQLP